jgi:hypothetical protein
MKQFKSDNRTYRFDHRIKPIEIRDRQQEYQHVSKYGQVDFKIHAYRNVNMYNDLFFIFLLSFSLTERKRRIRKQRRHIAIIS